MPEPSFVVACRERCVICSAPADDEHEGVYCSDRCATAKPLQRFACSTCGQFVAEDAVECDPEADRWLYRCAKCGVQEQEPVVVTIGWVLGEGDSVTLGSTIRPCHPAQSRQP